MRSLMRFLLFFRPVFTNSGRCADTYLSTNDGVLVGAEGTVADRVLELGRGLSHTDGARRNMLYDVAQRKTVSSAGVRQLLLRILLLTTILPIFAVNLIASTTKPSSAWTIPSPSGTR